MMEIITFVFEFRSIHMHSFVISALLCERCWSLSFMHLRNKKRENEGNVILGKIEVEQITTKEQQSHVGREDLFA